jgi:hypothetical protein
MQELPQMTTPPPPPVAPTPTADPQLDRVRRAFDAAFLRMCAAPTVADLEDELSNLLHQLHRLGELCRWRLGTPTGTKLTPKDFGVMLAGSDHLRAARAAMWARTFDTHDLVVVASPADLFSDFYTEMFGVLGWQPLAQTDPDGRHLDYAAVLEGLPVLDTIRRAFDAMAGLL